LSVIRELAPELLGDYLRFFENDAFSDNPRWASCYCHFSQAPHKTEKWSERTARDKGKGTLSVDVLFFLGVITSQASVVGAVPTIDPAIW